MSSTRLAASILASFSTNNVSMQPTKMSLEKQSDLQTEITTITRVALLPGRFLSMCI